MRIFVLWGHSCCMQSSRFKVRALSSYIPYMYIYIHIYPYLSSLKGPNYWVLGP